MPKFCECGRAFNARGECRYCFELGAWRSQRLAYDVEPLGVVMGHQVSRFGANDMAIRRRKNIQPDRVH